MSAYPCKTCGKIYHSKSARKHHSNKTHKEEISMLGSHPDSRESGAPSLASSLDVSESHRIYSALSSEQEKNRAEVELEGEKEVRARVQAECLKARKMQEELQEQQSGQQRQEQKHTVENARHEQEAVRQEKELMRAHYEQELQDKQGKSLRQQEEQEAREGLQEAAVLEQQKLEAKLESVVGEKEQLSVLLVQERRRQQEVVAELEQEKNVRQRQEQEAQEFRCRAEEQILKEQAEKKELSEAQVQVLEQKRGLAASLQEAAAAKADISGVLEQERIAAAQTSLELVAEKERAAEMAATNERLEQEKTEVTVNSERQKQKLESDLSRVTVVVEELQEAMDKLEADLVKVTQAKEGAEAETVSLRKKCDKLGQEVGSLQGSVIGLREKSEELAKYGEAAAKEADGLRNVVLELRSEKTQVEGELELVSCKDSFEAVNQILKKLGAPVMTNLYYGTMKQLLERISSVMVDREAIQLLVKVVKEALNSGETCKELGLNPNTAGEWGLRLLFVLGFFFPSNFLYKDVIMELLSILEHNRNQVAPLVLSILTFIGKHKPISETFPELNDVLEKLCLQFVSLGTSKQAKQAIKCMFRNSSNFMEGIFPRILEVIKEKLNGDKDEHFLSAIVALGHLAFHLSKKFPAKLKTVVSQKIVKELLLKDVRPARGGEEAWCTFEELCLETQLKVEGMKMMARWVLGLGTDKWATQKTLKLLNSVMENGGDLLEEGKPNPAERAWLRLAAGCAMLKIYELNGLGDQFSTEQYFNLSKLVMDPVMQVREQFLVKLHKGLGHGSSHLQNLKSYLPAELQHSSLKKAATLTEGAPMSPSMPTSSGLPASMCNVRAEEPGETSSVVVREEVGLGKRARREGGNEPETKKAKI